MIQDGRTHHEFCWRDHRDCAAARVEERDAEIARLRGLLARTREEIDSFDDRSETGIHFCSECHQSYWEEHFLGCERAALLAELDEFKPGKPDA